jgi:hypothetical protein
MLRAISVAAVRKFSCLLIALLSAAAPALAAEDEALARMATCGESWFDWQAKDPAQLQKFGDHVRASFAPHGDDGFLVPKGEVSVAGLRVIELFPNSVGMGVGFSVTVAAPFDRTRRTIEKSLGKAFVKCPTGDGMRTCALQIGEKRTLMLMAQDDPKAATTLVGCYYFYEK